MVDQLLPQVVLRPVLQRRRRGAAQRDADRPGHADADDKRDGQPDWRRGRPLVEYWNDQRVGHPAQCQ
jgi:hypothetical protein